MVVLSTRLSDMYCSFGKRPGAGKAKSSVTWTEQNVRYSWRGEGPKNPRNLTVAGMIILTGEDGRNKLRRPPLHVVHPIRPVAYDGTRRNSWGRQRQPALQQKLPETAKGDCSPAIGPLDWRTALGRSTKDHWTRD